MTQQTDEYDKFDPVPIRHVDPVPPEPLGLLPCLFVQIDFDKWGCFICKRKQPAGSYLVWVPMDTKPGDTAASVIEACDDPKGHAAAWCLDCARTLGGGTEGT
jgi:hypothetical protein